VHRYVRSALDDRPLDFAGKETFAPDRGEGTGVTVSGGTDDLYMNHNPGMSSLEQQLDDLCLRNSETRASGSNGYLGWNPHRFALTIQVFVIVQIEQHSKGIEVLLTLLGVSKFLRPVDRCVKELGNDPAGHLING
jgi:hypothetical protein